MTRHQRPPFIEFQNATNKDNREFCRMLLKKCLVPRRLEVLHTRDRGTGANHHIPTPRFGLEGMNFGLDPLMTTRRIMRRALESNAFR